MDSSDASVFEEIVSKQLPNLSDGLRFTVIHKRVQFKLWAAKYFLSKLVKLEKDSGSIAYPSVKEEADLYLDAFLYEVIGAFDTLLQEINIAFECNLDIEDVKMDTVIPKMPNGSKVLEKLGRLNGDSNGWFWKLREYRNHSAHRSVISLYSTGTVRAKPTESTDDPRIRHLEVDRITATYLIDDPRDIDSGKSEQEVIPYCSKSINNMANLITEIYEKCVNEIK